MIYPFWVGLMIFMTRGDLLSSFAYTVGVTVAMFPFIMIPPARVRARVAASSSGLGRMPT